METRCSGEARIWIRGGNTLGGLPCRGWGGGALRPGENCENFQKIGKCIILAYFSKKLKPALNYRAFRRETNLLKFFVKFFDENTMEN